jgi:hypothetical protein
VNLWLVVGAWRPHAWGIGMAAYRPQTVTNLNPTRL